jgi:hypothetical protein
VAITALINRDTCEARRAKPHQRMRSNILDGSRPDYTRWNDYISVQDDGASSIDSSTLELTADETPSNAQSKRQRRSRRVASPSAALCLLLAGSLPLAMSQSCISLANSRTCPAFNASSVATTGVAASLFPFLSGVNSVDSFDTALDVYIRTSYTQTKYVTIDDRIILQLGRQLTDVITDIKL